MTYCQSKSKAIVSYHKTSGIQEKLVYFNTPISIEFNRSTINCWRFYGVGDDAFVGSPPDKNYELFASGNIPGFKLNSGHNSRGYTPTMDGVLLAPESYWYRSGYGYESVNTVNYTSGYQSSGSCPTGGKLTCEIVITDSKSNTYRDAALCHKSFSVSCDEDCPPDHIRCEQSGYPGYCCLPCNPIAQRINNLAARL